MAFNGQLCREVKTVFVNEVRGWIRRRARNAGSADGPGGAVVFVERFSQTLALNAHDHARLLDGLFDTWPGGSLTFLRTPCPDDGDLEEVVWAVRIKVARRLRRHGSNACSPSRSSCVPILTAAET